MLGTGYWMLDTGCWMLALSLSKGWILDAGYWMESRQPRFLRDQSRQAAGRRGWILALSLSKGWMESRQPRFLRDQSRQAAGRRGWMTMKALKSSGAFCLWLPDVRYAQSG